MGLRVHRGVVRGPDLRDLETWTSHVQSWPAGSHIWGHYAEQTTSGDAICRTENVSACHAGFDEFVGDALCRVARDALGVEVVAFKDKLNYKLPGGAGFRPHQDAVAYPGAGEVMSVLVAIDACTVESGCLWLAAGVVERLPTDDRGVVRSDMAESLPWEPAELEPGDALCVGGLTPHFSEANRSARPRRVLVASYAPTSEGYGREQYYAARKAGMERSKARDNRFRISTLADFAGTEAPVHTAPSAAEACTHPLRHADGPPPTGQREEK